MMTQKLRLALLGLLAFALNACGNKEQPTETQRELTPGEQLLAKSTDAHGGVAGWKDGGQLRFRWTYHAEDMNKVIDSLQTVDTSTYAVAHEADDGKVRFGWNDGTAWISPADATFNSPPEFWSLTPTYFVGIPFVFSNPGTKLERLEETKAFEGKDYLQLKVTYESSAGDSPDDYYVLLIDPETYVTRGAYYIVTHPSVAAKGVGPEKFITLDGLRQIGGVLLPTAHKTHQMTDGIIGEKMRYSVVSHLEWLPKGTTDLSIPEGARIIGE